ncbi:MAG: cytochrome ubiquinol oxidase subunit I [Chloroflexota bacterium]
MPVAEVPAVVRAETIALFAALQTVFAIFAFGSPLVGAFAEWRAGRTGDARYLRLARDLARLNTSVFGLVALGAIVLIFLLAALWPVGGPRLLNLYFWPISLVGLFFLLEGTLLAFYVRAWRLAPAGRHLALGVAATLVGLALLLDVNSGAAAVFAALPYAFASGHGPEFLADRFAFLPLGDPGWGALALYRVVGALSLVGLTLATLAAWRHRRARDQQQARYLRWLTARGLRFAFLPLLTLPLIAWLYVASLPNASPAVLLAVVEGDLRWAFAAQIFLVAALFLLANWYVVRSLDGTHGEGAKVARQWLFVAGGIAVALGAAAAWYGSANNLAPDSHTWAVVGVLVALYAIAFVMLDHQERVVGVKGDWSRFVGFLVPLAALCLAATTLPTATFGDSSFPRADPWPWQLAGIIGLGTLALPGLAVYWRARAKGLLAPRVSLPALVPVLTGLTAVSLAFLMGYVRDIAVGSYVLFRQLAVSDDVLAAARPPSEVPVPPATALWLLTFAVLLCGVLILQEALPALREVPVEETAVRDTNHR